MKVWASASTATMALAIGALGMITTAASAQEAPPAPAPADEAQEGAGATKGIQDIIVTASRRPETLQRTAIPVTAISGADIEAKGVADIQGLTKLAPALKIGAVAGGSLQITARGVGTFGGNNFNEPGVSVNLDGAYIPRTAGSNGIFYDVQRVELLKGPQGTLYGRNTTGGVLNIITNDPTDKLGADLTLEAGNFALLRASGAVNLPITEGVALRVAAQGVSRDGYLSDGYNDDNGYSVRGKLKLDFTPDLSILLEANYTKVGGQGYSSVFSPYIDPGNPYIGPSTPASNANFNIPGIGPLLPRTATDGFLNNRTRGLQATINYDFGPVKATVVVNNVRQTQQYLQYGNGFPVRDDTRFTPLSYTTAELRLASDNSGPLKWVVGGYYFKDRNRTNAVVNQGFTFADTRDLNQRTTSYAGFGEATYAIIPRLRLTAGGRYTTDTKSLSGVTLGAPAPCFAPSAPGVDPVRGRVCVTPDTGQATFSRFTYKLGIDADIGPRSLVYANYSTGFKSGGFFAAANFNPAGTFPSNAYRPETIAAWTIGSKNRFARNTIQINAEAFYWTYKNKQVSHLGFVPPNNVILLVDNAGSATIYGAEVEAVWQPTKNDDLTASVQYQYSRYDSFAYNAVVTSYAQPFAPGSPVPRPLTGCGVSPTVGIGGAPRGAGAPGLAVIDCTGRQISLAPSWTGQVTYRHIFALPGGSRIVTSASTNISSGFWLGEEYFAGQFQRAYITGDMSLAFTPADNRVTITAYVNNIGDTAVGQASFLQATVQRALVFLRPPRTFGLRASFHF